MRCLRLTPVLAVLACLAAAAPARAGLTHGYGRAFCKGQTVHDYQAPFAHLPLVRRVKLDEDLPFGPRNMSIYQSAFSRVIVGKGGFGYRFFDDTYGRREKVTLDWDVTTTLSRIDRRGRVLRQADSEEQYFGVVTEIGEMDFWFDLPSRSKRALYRYDIEFVDHSTGEVLGRYGDYVRVVPPTYHARIAVDRDRVRTGEKVYARVENRGTSWVAFGTMYEVQKREGGRWVEQDLGVDAWTLPLFLLAGGRTSDCMRYRVPTDASPARYRFVKNLGFSARGRGKDATAAFTVAP
jgi:hypothetical protein